MRTSVPLSTVEHLSLSPRLCVVDWNRIFLLGCLYSLVIALCLAEQSQCSIKLWHIHLSHSLWSDRKPRKKAHIHIDTHTRKMRYNPNHCVLVYSTHCVIIFWHYWKNASCSVLFDHGHEPLNESFKKIQPDTFKWKRNKPSLTNTMLTF